MQPLWTPFLIWNQSVVPCTVLTVAFWPAYRFLRGQVGCSGTPISLRIFCNLLWSTLLKAAYLRLLLFLPAILIPACASSSLAFCTVYSAYKLNNQGDNIQPWHTPFPVCCSTSSSNCCFLTCIQISQEAGKVMWYSHLFKSFLQFVVIHTVKDLGIINKAEVDVFLELSCFFYDPVVSGSYAFF